MNSGDIAFPNLGIYLENVPKTFTIFGFEIAFYGLIIGIGILAGIFVAAHLARATGQNPDIIWDFAVYAVIFSVIGGRIYYVVFMWDIYKGNLLEILNLRHGGMAIYGAVIGAFITLFLYCRIKKLNPFMLGDLGVCGLILGQAIGRWGNFMNREVFGEYTDNLFAMRLPIAAVRASDITDALASHIGEGENFIQVHPTFLYESAWNLLVFAVMVLYIKHKRFDGELCLLYFFGYGIGRFVIEGIRTDTLFIPNTEIPVSQLLSLVMVVAALAAEIVIRSRLRRKEAPQEQLSEK
ncbi:MAG: prolipoprotein diacylglyceryl transferase [Lachnospiraceae bacterium]|nr:prolipoprotein diacylglyceryl transferase [Lachnospiraceae bacterium]